LMCESHTNLALGRGRARGLRSWLNSCCSKMDGKRPTTVAASQMRFVDQAGPDQADRGSADRGSGVAGRAAALTPHGTQQGSGGIGGRACGDRAGMGAIELAQLDAVKGDPGIMDREF